MSEDVMTVPLPACTLRANDDAEVLFGADDGKGGVVKDRFRITGYSGEMIPGHWHWGDLVLDLDGIGVQKQRSPVLLDHDRGARVGFTESIEKTHSGGLVVTGSFLKSTAASKQVLEEAREGYPWQASIHAQPIAIEKMKPGERARINGRDFEFPTGGTVFRKSRFREVSFVTLGADESTSAEALSAAEKVSVTVLNAPVEKKMEEKKEPAAAAPPMTLERLKAEAPDVFAAAFAAGVNQERTRLTEIFDAAPDAHRETFGKCLKDGLTVTEGLKLLIADTRRIKTDALAAIQKAGDKPVGGATDTTAPAYASDEERFKAEYVASASLQKEFGDVESYVGFRSAKAAGCLSLAGREA